MAETERTRFAHGRILTEDPAQPQADTMVVENGRIAWVGWEHDLPETYAGGGCRVEDLDGARAIPGFVDAHMHAVMLANFAPQISALPPAVNSIAELTEAVRAPRRAGTGRLDRGLGLRRGAAGREALAHPLGLGRRQPGRTRVHHAHMRAHSLREQPRA